MAGSTIMSMIHHDVSVSLISKRAYLFETYLWMSLNVDWRKWCDHRITIWSKWASLRSVSEIIGPLLTLKTKKHLLESSCLTQYSSSKMDKTLTTNLRHKSHLARGDVMYRSWCFLGSFTVGQIDFSELKSSTRFSSMTSTMLCKMMILIIACMCHSFTRSLTN